MNDEKELGPELPPEEESNETLIKAMLYALIVLPFFLVFLIGIIPQIIKL